MSRTLLPLFLLPSIWVLATRPALAQSAAPPAPDREHPVAAPPASTQDAGTASDETAETGAAAGRDAKKLERAATLKAEADDLSRHQRYAEAIALYEQAYALGSDPAVLYNQGRAYDKLGDSAAALTTLRRFEAAAPPELLEKVRRLDELLAELEGKVTRLTVLANVPGARVTLEDRVLGQAPLRELPVNAGIGTLEVTREGYYPVRLEVDLPKGAPMTLQAELRTRESSGLLRITSGLDEVTAFVDGKQVGRVPAEVALEPGEHQIRVSKQGYRDETTTIVVRAGAERSVDLDPRVAKKKLTQRWWFWTALGTVVVTSGAAATIAATKERDGTKGDFSPETLNAPLIAPVVRF